jgi:hypothetical protein
MTAMLPGTVFGSAISRSASDGLWRSREQVDPCMQDTFGAASVGGRMGLDLDLHEHSIARAASQCIEAVRGPAVSEDECMLEPALHGAGVCISMTRHGEVAVRVSDSQLQADDTAVCSRTHRRPSGAAMSRRRHVTQRLKRIQNSIGL